MHEDNEYICSNCGRAAELHPILSEEGDCYDPKPPRVMQTEDAPDTTPRNNILQRCQICDWPLAKRREDGCVEGDCSYRPPDHSPEWRRIYERRRQITAGKYPPSEPVADVGGARPKYWCQACRDVGHLHCSDPTRCGGMLKDGVPLADVGGAQEDKYGTRSFIVREVGGDWAVFDRKFGGLQCYRPDAESAQKAAECLELTGKFPKADVGGAPKIELVGPSGDGCHIAVNGEHYAYGNLEANAWKAALQKALSENAELRRKLATPGETAWIDCKQRMPTERGWYLTTNGERCDVGMLLHGTTFMGHALQFKDVTHWQPLPTPPEATQ